MPQALATAIIAAVGATGIAAAAITVAVYIGFTVGLNVLINSLFGATRPKPSDGQQTVRQSAGSRVRNYGIVHTGGTLSFFESANGTLAEVVTQGTGEETEILEHRINDKVVTVNSAGTVTNSSYRGAIHIYALLGSSSQLAISQLTAKFPQWTANHRQRGCTHAAIICDPVKQKYFSEVYNSQQPAYTSVRKGVKLYDPRKDSTAVIYDDGNGYVVNGTGSHRLSDPSTWEWSDNWALVTADYFAHSDGYGGGVDNVNWTNIAGEADASDEQVITVTSEQISRWRIWASYSLASEERRNILADMVKAADGFCWQDASCKFNLMAGRYEAPTITITDDHILAMTATLGPKAQHRVDSVKVLYTEAAIGYREQESATFGEPGSTVDPNTDPQAIQAYYVPHHNQAVRIGKLTLLRLGLRWHLTLTLNLFGLNLLGSRFCRVESAQLGVAADFVVDGPLRLQITAQQIEVTLTEVRSSDWDFDASTEEGTPPVTPDETTTTPIVIPVPTGLTLAAVQIVLGGATAVSIEASWDAGRADLGYEARYRPSAGGTWIMMSVDDDALTARSGAVDSGTEYEVQIRAVTYSYRVSDWSSSVLITPVATATLPAPIALSATGGTGEATVSFSMPSGATVAYARLYHNDSNDFGSATQVGSNITASPGELVTVNDTGLSAGNEYYWARAYDGLGGSSSLAGPVSATIS